MIALHDLDAPMRPSDMEQRHGRIIRQGNTNSKVDIYRYTTDKTFDAYLYQMLENKQRFISQIMTDKSPVRSCEDVDEIALDYAEVKALCAGNPLIKEKIDLETEITKLNVLKSNFLSQKYAVQDKAYIILPQAKDTSERMIKKLNTDIETTAKQQPLTTDDGKNYYPVTVNGTVYHDKEQAGKAIRNAILTSSDVLQGKEITIGEYRGLAMSVYADTLNERMVVNLKGETNHYGEINMNADVKASGNIIRLDNVINGIGIALQKEEEHLRSLCSDIEEAKQAAEAVFPQENVLTEKEKRLAEVNTLLALTKASEEPVNYYSELLALCPELAHNSEAFTEFEAGECYDKLCIQRNGNNVVMEHYFTQSGDIMADPAVTFVFDTENKVANIISYQNDCTSDYQTFEDDAESRADCEEFVTQWFENIAEQGYEKVSSNDERSTSVIDR